MSQFRVRLLVAFSAAFMLSATLVKAQLKDDPGPNPKPGVEKFDFDYQFGRPVKPGEMTYNDYRKKQKVAYTQHSATSEEAGAFDTGLIEPKAKSKAVVLTKVGTYPYHCSIHGKTMHAEIVVKE